MDKAAQKKFFLISFIPAVAYWYLESRYPIRVAVMGGVGLAILELALEKVFTNHLHALSKFNFFLISFLGVISFIGDEGIWFKLQPAFTGVGIGGYLFFRRIKGRSLLYEMSSALNSKTAPPRAILESMERDVVFLFLAYGIFMVFIAIFSSTDRWLFFKTIGFYIIFAIFMIIEMVLARWRVRKELARIHREKILSSFRY